MSRSVRDKSPARSPHPPGRDAPKDKNRREFKEMVDALFRRFMSDFNHADPATAEAKATLLKVFALTLIDHATAAPKETV